MILSPLLYVSSALTPYVLASRLPSVETRDSSSTTSITWSECPKADPGSNLECGQFPVPLDYADSSVGSVNLAVARYKAVSQPRLGTIWIHPGGPGGSGVSFVKSAGEIYSNATGGYFDIAGWDQRGVKLTGPDLSCFQDPAQERQFWNGTLFYNGIEVKGAFTSQVDLDALYNQTDIMNARLSQLPDLCANTSGQHLQYVGTAATARDMVALNDALEGPGSLVNFWGLSYGTIVGSFFVNMFPERIGRIILDGVVNPDRYTNAATYLSNGDDISDAEKVLQVFADKCSEAGGNCSIANGKTGDQVYQWILSLIDATYDSWKRGGPLPSSALRSTLFSFMYRPRLWYDLSDALNSVASDVRNGTSTKRIRRQNVRPSPPLLLGAPKGDALLPRDDEDIAPVMDYSMQAITCADALGMNAATKDVLDNIVNVTRNVSAVFGPMWGFASNYCHRWPTRAVERYAGPWNKWLNNQILILSNKYDPITPLHNAQYLADQLQGSSVLVVQDGFGHTTRQMRSDCMNQVVGKYFIAGEVPNDNTVCETNQPLFQEDFAYTEVVNRMTDISPQAVGSRTAQPLGSSALRPSIGSGISVFLLVCASMLNYIA